MGDYCFSFLENKFPEFAKECKDVEENVVEKNYKATVLLAGALVEKFTLKVGNLAGIKDLERCSQYERLNKLGRFNIIQFTDQVPFNRARKIRNKVSHGGEASEDDAYVMHRMLYKVAVWFYKKYGDSEFVPKKYYGPIYVKQEPSNESIESMIEKVVSSKMKDYVKINEGDSQTFFADDKSTDCELNRNVEDTPNQHSLQDFTGIKIKGSYLLGELYKLKNSSKEAVENSDSFNSFKQYLHVERGIQKEFIEKLKEVSDDNSAHLVMLCGNVGDGKSHLLAYLNTNHPDLANKFKIHNDATESFDPNKNSIDTLANELSAFKDINIKNSNEKVILAINLGVLNNFMESDYAKNEYTIIKEDLENSNILDPNYFSQNYDTKYVNIISFADYNMFELNEDPKNRASSKYISSLLQKVVDDSLHNPFYQAYLKDKEQGIENPVIYNYEMLSNRKVCDVIVNSIIKIFVKYKKIISTRELLNFIHEILVPSDIKKPDEYQKTFEYLKDLLPNLLYTKVNSSDLLKRFNYEDPINLRNEVLDDFIIKLNISDDLLSPIRNYIDVDAVPLLETCFEGCSLKNDFLENKREVISLLIRFASIFGKDDIENVFVDNCYVDYLDYLYYYNTEDLKHYQNLFKQVNNAVFNWRKYMGLDIINIDELTNFYVGSQLNLAPKVREEDRYLFDLNKGNKKLGNRFKTNILISFSVNNNSDLVSLNIDYPLYSSLVALNKGFKPNKTGREKLIVFKEFIDSIISQTEFDNKLFINSIKDNKNFSFEYDELFGKFSFNEV